MLAAHQLEANVLDPDRSGNAHSHDALQQLARGLVLAAAEDDEVVIEPATRSHVRERELAENERAAYRMSKRVRAFLPVTDVNGLNEGILYGSLRMGGGVAVESDEVGVNRRAGGGAF